MRIRFFCLVLVLCLFVISSCVQNHKVVLLQKDDVNKKGLPKDSVVRSYNLEKFDYKIQTNDILSVRYESLTPKEFNFFLGDFQSNANATFSTQGNALLVGELVDEEGNIPMPVVGKVSISGMTIFEAQDKLQKIADQYLESPIVKVRLLNYRITVLGEVNKEGTITLGNNRVSMMEALGLAGGLGELADRSNIKVIRQEGTKTEVFYINLLKEDFMSSPYYYVHQGDVLIVPPLRQRPYRRYFSQNFALVVSTLSVLLLVINYTK